MSAAHRRARVARLAGWALFAGTLASGASNGDSQAPPAPARNSPSAAPFEPAPSRTVALAVYRRACLNCHDNDGKGEIGRDLYPKVPDFSDPAWHDSRTDADLIRSVLNGKGKMPAMRTRVWDATAEQMVAFVRLFRGGNQVVEDEPEQSRAGAAAASLAQREAAQLFRRLCAACHDTDGRGSVARGTHPNIPDFTLRTWQEKRRDPRLLASILDGKGSGMPAFREKVRREQARMLIGFIRSFSPTGVRPTAAAPDEFDARFHKLVEEVEDLRRQFRALQAPPL
jgi:mono/diheme cytochrome c family protein